MKRRGNPGRHADLHRRRPALPAAGAAQAAGGACGGVLHAGRLGQHVRPRPQARQDLLLLGGAGPAARVPLARDGVRRAHHRGVGVQRAGVLPGERHAAALLPPPGFAKVREIIDERYNPGPLQHLPLLCLRRRQLRERYRGRAGRTGSIAADACYTGYVEVSSGLSRQLATETGRLFAELPPRAAPPAATRSMTSTTSGARCGTSSPPRARPWRAPLMSGDWQTYVRRIEELAARSGLKFPPGRLRGGARQLHDGDRRLRAAGAHAALVLRRALHLPADPAPHGPLAPVRGGVSRAIPGMRISPRAMGLPRTCW